MSVHDAKESEGMRRGKASTRAGKQHKQPRSSIGLSNLSLSRTVPRKASTTSLTSAAPIILE